MGLKLIRFTKADDELVLRFSGTDKELSGLLGRTVLSIQARRNRLTKGHQERTVNKKQVLEVFVEQNYSLIHSALIVKNPSSIEKVLNLSRKILAYPSNVSKKIILAGLEKSFNYITWRKEKYREIRTMASYFD